MPSLDESKGSKKTYLNVLKEVKAHTQSMHKCTLVMKYKDIYNSGA